MVVVARGSSPATDSLSLPPFTLHVIYVFFAVAVEAVVACRHQHHVSVRVCAVWLSGACVCSYPWPLYALTVTPIAQHFCMCLCVKLQGVCPYCGAIEVCQLNNNTVLRRYGQLVSSCCGYHICVLLVFFYTWSVSIDDTQRTDKQKQRRCCVFEACMRILLYIYMCVRACVV